MHSNKFLPHVWAVTFAFVALLAATPQVAHADEPGDLAEYRWLDAELQPLPFQDYATIREVMRISRVISRELIGRGKAGAEVLILKHDDTRFRAVFRTVDVDKESPSAGGVRKRPIRYRDAAIFENAAYELSELLGIGRVPPTVGRRIDEHNGTVQIWLEETLPEDELLNQDLLQPPDVLRWRQQKQIMYVFDNLIYNSDRNQGNIMIDRSWTLWFIDHTRAFRWSSKLPYPDKVTSCERSLWKALRDVDEDAIRQLLEPYLVSREISYLLRRRKKLIDHIEKLIKNNGEDAVIFDVRPPGSEKATWGD